MTKAWIRDTGLVFALVFLFLGYKGNKVFLALAALFLLLVLFAPKVLRPLAFIWMKIAEYLGFVMNKVFFGIIFFIVITPIGILKRIFGGDLRGLKKDSAKESAFLESRGRITKVTFEKPY